MTLKAQPSDLYVAPRAKRQVPLAPLTTLAVGGPAAQLVRITDGSQAEALVAWWSGLPQDSRPPLLPLGGGSNLLVSDRGFDGLVVKMENSSLEILQESGDQVLVRVGAGMLWDQFVAETAARGWAGVECLSGIPGCVGAAPVQNIGAYGQEVAETIVTVRGFDLSNGQSFARSAEDCGFAYRDSSFKQAGMGRYLIVSVEFALRPGGPPTVRYRDLQERCQDRQVSSLQDVRDLVLEVRRGKSMVYDPSDDNHRSAGSFFTNPIVEATIAQRLAADTGMPRYPATPGYEKLSAAWLIEHSGLPKGFKPSPEARVGLSTNHVLALTNRGGASAAELLQLADLVTEKVRAAYGVELVPEPVLIGF
jgi:UDP-N-acetylmuramate dehydrogenase